MLCKKCALVTVGKTPLTPPDMTWKQKILRARHSPIRVLEFVFRLEGIPYFASVHLCRHVHAQPFVRSQRSNPDRGSERQDAPVDMYWMMNADELQSIARARLCSKADPVTQGIVREMCKQVEALFPEFSGLFGPLCCTDGCCREMSPCDAPPFCATCKHAELNEVGYPDGCDLRSEKTDPSDTCAFWEEVPHA